MYLNAAPPPGQYVSNPYTVITTGNLFVVNQQQAPSPQCSLPAGFPANMYAGTPAPCWTGAFDQGDGAVFKNGAHDIQITGSKVLSTNQASIHIVSGGEFVRVIGTTLGYFDSEATWDCYRVEAAANPNLHIAGNDCAGANDPSPNPYASPYPLASVGYLPAIRNHRSVTGFIYGPTSGAPAVTNLGPYDCTYYISWTGATVTALSLQYAGQAARNILSSPLPPTIFVPVGATLASTVTAGSPSSIAFCLP